MGKSKKFSWEPISESDSFFPQGARNSFGSQYSSPRLVFSGISVYNADDTGISMHFLGCLFLIHHGLQHLTCKMRLSSTAALLLLGVGLFKEAV